MRIEHEPGSDEAYIKLVPDDAPHVPHGKTVTLEAVEALGDDATDVVLDFDREGRLTGIEILAAQSLLRPETLDRARD
jgi:uncharacterized protein YuzE